MKSVYLLAASLLSTFVHGSPFHSHVRQRQGASYYRITGATGGVYPRMELRELEKTGEMWNLFLLAMTDFQKMDQNTIDSWFQIAGIHGMPWTDWDGVKASTAADRSLDMGYCPHNQLLFSTWHRPYLMLFEQKLQQIAIGIANQFPTATRAKYQDAATRLRLPYWDWAKNVPTTEPVVPTSLSVEKVQVTMTDGSPWQIDNPLFDYNFHPLDNTQINGTGCPANSGTGGLPRVCDESQVTIRASPDFNDNATLNSRLRDILRSQRSALFKILSQYQKFDHFSSDAFCGDTSGRLGSVEAIHGPIHVKNFPGHMSPSSVTAFDPMFWFHHANVDRQVALYQAVFPNTYVGSCKANTATWTIDIDEPLDGNSPLTPFHKTTSGAFWTSNDVRDITTLGYTYPELVGNPPNATLVSSIKAQYSDAPTARKLKSKRQDTTPQNNTLYLAEITLPLYGLDDGADGASPYSVLVFVGDVGTDAAKWAEEDSFVGLASTIGGTKMRNEQVAVSTVDLSVPLDEAIASGAATEEKAMEYLKEKLKWRIELGDAEIPREKVKGLTVKLISTQVEIAKEEGEFDRWVGGFVEYGEVDV